MPRAPATVDEYIDAFAPEVRAILQKLRSTVREAAPGAEERISYRMPAFFQDGVLVYFAAFKKHIGLYPPVRDPKLSKAIEPYAGPKGNLQFPLDRTLPYALIRRIVKSRLRENRQRLAERTSRRS